MKKILGLDLGTNSIGWALIEVELKTGKPIRVIAMGSRIIPLSAKNKTQFEKGESITTNQERTTSRTQRKNYDRKQLRKSDDFKYSLKKELKRLGIFPDDALMKIPMLELWKLRNDAATEPIEAEQLGRILYMLNQKRGYKSMSREGNAEKKDTESVTKINERYTELKDSQNTIGQHFYNKLLTAQETNTYFRVKENIFPREEYIEEFDTIMNVQKNAHPFLSNEIIDKLRKEIIYYQRNLKSQKGLVNICEFEGFEKQIVDKKTNKNKTVFIGPRVTPRTSPIFQLCKIWETVNNITLKIKETESSKNKWFDFTPNIEQKESIVKYLSTHPILKYSELLKILKLRKDNVIVNKQIQKGIQGNITYSELHKILGNSDLLKFDLKIIETNEEATLIDKKTGEILEENNKLIISSDLEKEPLYQLWHTVYSIKDLDECKSALIKRFKISPDKADALSRLDFNKQAFGNKSAKAMRNILPYLMQGYVYSEACCLAGYNHSNSLTKEEQKNKQVKNKLDLLSKNSLHQPVVEKIINQMINVVNAIIDKYGKPDEIKIELARELKKSKDERDNADKANIKNKKINDLISSRLQEMGIPATKKYIQKYRLIFPIKDKNWKKADIMNQCIYCGNHFNLSEALNGENFDVDHIIPKSLLFDDSQNNKVLVHRSCNSNKKDKTAYDYISKQGEQKLEEYKQRIDDWSARGILSYGKTERLKASFEEYLERKKIKKETEADKNLWENFITRQLRETQYISRKSKQLLEQICNKVTVTEGSVTARLRKVWGWDDVLMNLQLPKYKQLDQTEIIEWTSEHGKRKHQKEQIANWSKRDDHRHHAIDALVIACTKQGYIQRINTLNSSDVHDEMLKKIEDSNIKYKEKLSLLDKYLITEKPFTTIEVEKEADKILISFKAGKKVATISKFKAKGKNKKQGVIVPRGSLHEEYVYGKIKIEEKGKSLKYLFENSDFIKDNTIKKLVINRLKEYNGDVKKALSSIKKNPIYMDEKNKIPLEKANCYKYVAVKKYELKDISIEKINNIVDKKVKEIVEERLKLHNNNKNEVFKDVLWYNEEKQIPIKTIRLFARPSINSLQPIKKNKEGKDIGFVVQGNNHHTAIYTTKENKLIQHICSFWHAVERKKYNLPIIIKNTTTLWDNLYLTQLPDTFLKSLPEQDLILNFSMQQNEMFILGLTDEEFEDALRNNDKPLLSKHLYLVWSLSNNDYWFRHHLETKNTELKDTDGAKEARRCFRFKSIGALIKENPKKIFINNLGEIIHIGEY